MGREGVCAAGAGAVVDSGSGKGDDSWREKSGCGKEGKDRMNEYPLETKKPGGEFPNPPSPELISFLFNSI